MIRPASLRTSISIKVTLAAGEQRVDLLEIKRLLREIADAKAISSAADAVGMTYRTIWGRLSLYEKVFGKPLVDKTPGQGTQLTPTGRALLVALDRELSRIEQPDASLSEAITEGLLSALGGESAPVRLLASHDFAVANYFSAHRNAPIEVRYVGGAKAARALLASEGELAGFHTALNGPLRTDPVFEAIRNAKEFQCVPVMAREQGILVARGNPHAMTSLTDLAKPGVRFVNRQRGSGTRVLLDQLLASYGLSSDAIDGYEQEEFTHQAVAAMIGAGAADAGLGLRAAAEIFRLDFISIGWETYFIAGKPETLAQSQVKAFCEALIASASTMAGYRAAEIC